MTSCEATTFSSSLGVREREGELNRMGIAKRRKADNGDRQRKTEKREKKT